MMLRAASPILLMLLPRLIFAQIQNYDLGVSAYRKQEYKKAVSLFAEAEKEAPGKTEALLFEGKALASLALLSQSEDVLVSYLQLHPDSFDALETLGNVQQRENKPKISLGTFTKAARLRTPSSEDLTSAALDYVLLDDYPDAIHWLQLAVELSPNNGLAWYDLGRCYYTQSHFEEAQKAFERAELLMPDDFHVPENLGLTLEAENMVSEAEQQYRKSIGLAQGSSKSDEWPYLDYGTFLLTHDRGAEAVSQLQAATAANPRCATCHEMLGRALAASGKIAEGVQQLEQAVALAPNEPKVHYELGRLYHQAGDDARAKIEFGFSAKMYGSKSQSEPPQ